MYYLMFKRYLKSRDTGPNGVQHHEAPDSHVNQYSSAPTLLLLSTAWCVWELLLVMLLWTGWGVESWGTGEHKWPCGVWTEGPSSRDA